MAEKVRAGSAASRAPSLLDEAAALWGVQPEYVTQDGRNARSPDESVLAALHTLGAPVHVMSDLPDAIRVGRLLYWERLVEPVVVSWIEEGPPSVELRLIAGEAEGEITCELTGEDGERRDWSVRGDELRDLRAVEVEGRSFVSGRLNLPADLPRGIHSLTVRAGARHDDARVFRANVRAWTKETNGRSPLEWGVFMPLYAIRTPRADGLADLTELLRLQKWTHGEGGEFVGTLPLLATFLDEPFEPSPYAPVSRLFWNELYLPAGRAPGIERARGAGALIASEDYKLEAARLRAQDRVDYRAAMAHRRRALEEIARAVAPLDEGLPPELAEFVAEKPDARKYAIFRAVGERERKPWRDWPGHTRAGSVGERDYDEEIYRYHLYVQWAMDERLLGQGRTRAPLYMDLPLGCHPDGFDAWRWRDLFADASLGAPPDPFQPGGQNWSFPPVDPFRSRREGHAYWVASLRHSMRACELLRLDHVMGLHRLFWVPRGMSAAEGVYVCNPADELYAAISLESHRWRTEVVGEDLGTVSDEVRKDMERHALRRMFVVPFELDRAAGLLPEPPANTVASLGTHDMPPFRALIDDPGEANAWAKAVNADSTDPEEMLDATLDHLGATHARLVLLSLEDLWLEKESQNRPGTPSTENWIRKASRTLEELEAPQDGWEPVVTLDRARTVTNAALFGHWTATKRTRRPKPEPAS